jgi:hypothetical protein
MKNKNLYLIVAIISALVFIGYLSETEPKTLLGFAVNIWVYRIAWLLITISFFMNYLKMKNIDNQSNS